MSISERNTAVDLSEKTTDDLVYKIAETKEEREGAFRLIYDSYFRAGLIDPNPYAMRVTPYHLLSTTEVFIAVCEQTPVCTVSLVVDGQLGLPMESIYADEVTLRRESGLLLGEVSCLADRRSEFKELFAVFIRLCRLMGQYAKRQGLDELLVAVHPRHARFYKRFMAFELIGHELAYPSVRSNPAVPLCFDFVRVEQEYPDIHRKFFENPIPDEQLRPRPISVSDWEHFRPMVNSGFDHEPPLGQDSSSQSGESRPALTEV